MYILVYGYVGLLIFFGSACGSLEVYVETEPTC
jgi:hypothetical protein